jgi:hypothetical protein
MCVTDILDILRARQSRDSVVGRAGSNPFRDKLCISAAEVSDWSWGLLSPNSMRTDFPWGVKWPWRDDAHLHLAPRLRISGPIPLLPQYA